MAKGQMRSNREAKKPKKHFKSLVTVHTKLISPVSNPAAKFDKLALLAKDDV